MVEEEVGVVPNSPTGSLASGVHPLYREEAVREPESKDHAKPMHTVLESNREPALSDPR